jgi:cytosine/adenosine deaminase-related metal-dependent hydrolase
MVSTVRVEHEEKRLMTENGPDRTLEQLQATAGDPRRRVLLQGATVLSMDPSVGDLERGDILLEGRMIKDVGQDLSDAAADDQAIVVDASGTIAVPGMHDTHRHSWQNQLRRLIPNADLAEYVAVTHVQVGPHYRPQDMYAGNFVSAMGAIDSGVTTVLDFSHNARSAAHSDAAIDAWLEAGIRCVHASCAPLQGDWDGQWPADLRRLRDERFSSDDGLVTLAMGVLGKAVPEIVDPAALSADGLRWARELALPTSIDGVFGALASSQLEQLGVEGLLGPDLTFIHCQDISQTAWELIADTGGHVSLAPTSDSQIGLTSAITPVQKALDMGIRPALSVDVECCLTTDMFTQMQVVLNIQRGMAFNKGFLGEVDPPRPIPVRDVFEFATVSGAKANWLFDKVGTLTPGKEADVLLIRVDDVNSMPLNNAYGSVVLGADPRNIETVFIAGQPRKWARQVVGLDLSALQRMVTESRDYVLKASGYELDVLSRVSTIA